MASNGHPPDLAAYDLPEEATVQKIDWASVAPVIADFLHDPAFVTGLFGPLGSAKTSSGAVKAWSYGQAWPGANIAVIRTTWPRLRDTTQREIFRWFPPGVAGTYDITPKTFHLSTGAAYGPNATITNEPAHLMFRAMDDQKDIEDVLSLSLAAAWVDEPQGGLAPVGKTIEHEPGLDHQLFLHLLSRLGRQSGYLRMCWLTGNPPDPAHWIAKEFQYAGKGIPTNPRSKFHLYLADRDTNRRNLYHEFQGRQGDGCALCGRARVPEEQAWFAIHQQGDYYGDLEAIFGAGTPLALRFIHGLWVPFKSLKPFDLSKVQYISEVPEQERPTIADCLNVLAVDPAITKKDEGCRSSVTLAGSPRQGLYRSKRIVWRNVSDHWSPYELCGKILEFVQRFPVKKLRIEKVAWQSALKDIVEREAKLAGIKLPYIELVVPRGDKLLRAMEWSGPVETGNVLFDPSCKDLIDCMGDIPTNKMAWDPVDATGLALAGLPRQYAPRSSITEAAETPERKRIVSYAPKGQIAPPPLVRVAPGRSMRARARGYAARA